MNRTYRDIRYTLKRSKRKTASIYVERDGQITLIAPEDLSVQQIEKVLEDKRRWIYTHLAEWHDLNATRIERQFVNGEGFLYLGRSYRLKLVPKQVEPLLLKDGHFCLRTDLRPAAKAVAAFKDFYRDKGLVRIKERVDYFKPRMDVEPKSVKILDLKNRWASWTPGGNLNFHWKCMMSPAKILDYIVVHELAHLIFPDHSAKFWNEVDKLLPDYSERKEWLRVHGAGMDL
ncbi:MAG: M48 family metallopeptidase [Planctomycetaceae bacterium]|nr:M48 family metallopeptidase [Planctomycetaceae bacterium]